jgi:hypothetical protein
MDDWRTKACDIGFFTGEGGFAVVLLREEAVWAAKDGTELF